MLRSLILQRNLNFSMKLYRTYLTKEFKDLMNQDVPLENVNKNLIEEITENRRTNPVRTDFMARTMTDKEECRQDMVEELIKLRLQSDAVHTIGSTGHYVIKNFLKGNAIPELLDILKNKIKYGVFVEKYSGSYLLDELLEKKLYLEACKVAVEHHLQDDYDSQLVCALSVKAGYEALKANLISSIKLPEPPAESKDVVKVRVKYIRNPYPGDKTNDLKHMIGLTLLSMSENAPTDIKANMEIPGFILTSKYDQALASLNSNTNKNWDKDILSACVELIKDNTNIPAALTEALDQQLKSAKSFLAAPIDQFLNEAIKQEEPSIMAAQKEHYQMWAQEASDQLQTALAKKNKAERLENVSDILLEINEKKKLLWYFDNEDKIDLEIYRKFKFHPKKWFGKKKKPRVIDENYIPPELR